MTKATQNNPLTITRIFDAPVERLWRAVSDSKEVQRWWGPKDCTCPFCSMDFKVGGKYVLCMRSDDGEIWNTGVFKEIIPMKKIVRMESAADEKGNAVPPSYYGHPELAMEFEMIWLFDEMKDGTTRMTFTHVGLSDSIRKECEIGWNQTFDKLAEIL